MILVRVPRYTTVHKSNHFLLGTELYVPLSPIDLELLDYESGIRIQ